MPLNAIDKQIYYRLIALWAICEGVLGGIIHGTQLPISGLINGGSAVIIICLMAYYVPEIGAIIKATIVVAIFKMMLSPQSPLPAYFAVFFQGVTGELFFLNRKYYKTACIIFATIALAESGVQRIITMTLIYGSGFWNAVNTFISGLTHQEQITNYSFYIAGGYALLHIIAGFFIGILAARIPRNMVRWRTEIQPVIIPHSNEKAEIEKPLRKRKFIKGSLFFIWIALVALYLQSELKIGKPLLSSDDILHILIRSFLIILTWYFLVSPLLTFLLRKWLTKQKEKSQSTINEILVLLPSTRNLLEKCWALSSNRKGLRRLNQFLKTVLVHSLTSSDLQTEKANSPAE